MPSGHVYITTNKRNGVLYVGMSSDLVKRIHQHKTKFYPKSFTAQYNLDKLVYYEPQPTMELTIAREKQIKAGSRAKKVKLIEGMNPEWEDLYERAVRELGKRAL